MLSILLQSLNLPQICTGTDPEILQGMWPMGWLPIVVETEETENGNGKLYW